MESSEAFDHIAVAVRKVAPFEMPELTPQTRVMEDLGLDSTSILELLLELEESIGFQADIEDLWPEIFQTLGDLSQYVARAAGISETA